MGKVRFGIAGCGQITVNGHIPNLKHVEHAQITALTDVNERALAGAAEMVGGAVRTFDDFDTFLACDDVDVVVVATPNWLHREQAVAGLEAGKHVFLEKPAGVDLNECDQIAEAAGSSGRLLQIGHELRHAKVFETAKEIVDSGRIGDVHMIRHNEFRKPLLPGWRQSADAGGAMLEKNSHFFDLFNWFAGSAPTRVLGSGANDVNKDSPLIDNCFVIVEYANGTRAALTMCLFCENGERSSFDLIGRVLWDRRYDRVGTW
jgi:predicted dehydrogenase